MGIKDQLRTGDRILDRAGHEAVRCIAGGTGEDMVSVQIIDMKSGVRSSIGARTMSPFPFDYYLQMIVGEVPGSEYAKTLTNFVQIQTAYRHNLELPEGATIVPAVMEDAVTPLEELNMRVLPLFISRP